MHVLPPYRRIVLLTSGRLGVFTSKTAAALLRYRAADIVGVIDAAAAGRSLPAIIPGAPDFPIFAGFEDAQAVKPDALFVGIAPPGGELPAEMRAPLMGALSAGVDVVSGLHVFLADDAEMADAARDTGAHIADLRRPPAARTIASGRARETNCARVLTVGSDGNVGKMVTSLELAAAARRRGFDARFLATGQTGIMIGGSGISIDAVVADFAAGAAEALALSVADAELAFMEGQGSIGHPGFSPVTLALLHGFCPDALILTHHLGRTHHRVAPHARIASLRELMAAYEQIGSLLHPVQVVGVAINAAGVSAGQALAARRELETELGLPVADPVVEGPWALLDAVVASLAGRLRRTEKSQ